jgi:multicomponent Na+:H+ antiporter subunit G
MILDILTVSLLVVGLFFFFATTVGLLRFPGFYARMHAAGKGDTLSSLLMLAGLIVFNSHHFSVETLLVNLKIAFILVFILMASPTATHAIINAGYEAGVVQWRKGEEEEAKHDLAN